MESARGGCLPRNLSNHEERWVCRLDFNFFCYRKSSLFLGNQGRIRSYCKLLWYTLSSASAIQYVWLWSQCSCLFFLCFLPSVLSGMLNNSEDNSTSSVSATSGFLLLTPSACSTKSDPTLSKICLKCSDKDQIYTEKIICLCSLQYQYTIGGSIPPVLPSTPMFFENPGFLSRLRPSDDLC